ncbi:MAG TPA: glycoside hydrolase family 2 TIM barrel-domain containing protein, partial [Chitinophagaceae bacterium]|nr:glycoside hydrolase family 2 TIM barrel-domain containing protein [Chitinophagaceae bacterium]
IDGMRQYKGWYFLVFLFLSINVKAQHAGRTNFNKGWKFKLDSTGAYNDPTINDAGWRTLNLPHDWSIEGSFSKEHPATYNGGALPGGIAWYRKTFVLPESQKNNTVFITFDGVYQNSEVWINGHSLGKRPNGYISFQYDLTPYLKWGLEKNVIAVKVDNSKQPNSRWYSGSGIYRNVWLVSTNKLHIHPWGTFITTPTVSSNEATIKCKTTISEWDNKANYTLYTKILDATGKIVAQSSKLINSEGKDLVQALNVPQPKLWSVDNPYLYKAVTQIKSFDRVLDEYETPFGIRYFNFSIDKGFSLNGTPLKIIGVCNHHDLGALGTAVNTRALERQLQLLKDMGCNGIRTSHNPPAPELLDLCDKMGFIVMDEAFDMWAKQKNPYDYHLAWKDWHVKDLEDQVLRDRNHPSVFMWSVGNEIVEQWADPSKGDSSGKLIARELVAIVKALDTSRPIVTANNVTDTGNKILQSGAFDLIGYNYHHREWASFKKRWPGKKFIVTESTSALQTRGHYDLVPFDTIRRWPKRWDVPFSNPDGGHTVSAYDHVSAPWGSTHEESIKALLDNEHVSGMYIWTGFDYLGEPTPYSWPARSSYFGIIDLAGFPKDVYYLYQSIFTTKPVLHLYPHWNWKRGDTVDVVSYYNNADEVELFLNNKSLGTKNKKEGDLHIKWRVPFEEGALKAVSRKKGKVVVSKEVKTAGTPAKIILSADRKIINGDGTDLSFITATVVDKNGITVPTANNLIQFKVSGEGSIAGVDSGDPVSHESFKGDQHTALSG